MVGIQTGAEVAAVVEVMAIVVSLLLLRVYIHFFACNYFPVFLELLSNFRVTFEFIPLLYLQVSPNLIY